MALLVWLRENSPLTSLRELSLASGVDLPSLIKLDTGQALPTAPQSDAIRRVLPDLPTDILSRHAIVVPEFFSTRRGTLPAGTELHVGAIRDLLEGDCVPYVPPKGREDFGSHWLVVRSTDHANAVVRTINFGGVVSTYPPDLSIRFARPPL